MCTHTIFLFFYHHPLFHFPCYFLNLLSVAFLCPSLLSFFFPSRLSSLRLSRKTPPRASRPPWCPWSSPCPCRCTGVSPIPRAHGLTGVPARASGRRIASLQSSWPAGGHSDRSVSARLVLLRCRFRFSRWGGVVLFTYQRLEKPLNLSCL